MTKTKKNHYNPKTYLKWFSDTKGYLWGYNKKNKKIIKRKYENFGHENYLYTQELEDKLAIYDGMFNKSMLDIINAINNDKEKISIESISNLATWLSFQTVRTPKAKKDLSEIVSKIKKENPLNEVPEIGELFDQRFNLKDLFERFMVIKAEEIFKLLTQHTWTLALADRGTQFITSDNSYSLSTVDLSEPNKSMIGFASSKTLKSFPLQKIHVY